MLSHRREANAGAKIMNDLLSVSPKTMGEDEQTIGRGYKKQGSMIVGLMVLGAIGHFLDLKDVVAAGFLMVIGAMSFAEARLYDLCIRLKRSNHLQFDDAGEVQSTLRQIDRRLSDILSALALRGRE
jgi:hypothetical protein